MRFCIKLDITQIHFNKSYKYCSEALLIRIAVCISQRFACLSVSPLALKHFLIISIKSVISYQLNYQFYFDN